MQQHIVQHELSAARRDFINKILTMTGKEIYDNYGLKRGETIIETVRLPDAYEMDIKCVLPDSDESTPWTEAVLFQHGQELCFTDPADNFVGEWTLSDSTHTFTVIVK